MNNYILGPVDTDGISFCKPDGSPFTNEERKLIFEELDKLDGELIRWEDDGVFEKVIILKAKNYILFDGEKIKLKGSSLKSSKLELALKEFQSEIIESIIYNREDFEEIYTKYCREALSVTDIKRWASKKSISATTINSSRKNETNVIDALAGKEYSEGDRFYMFYETDDKLCCVEDFSGTYDKNRLLKRLFDTCKIFGNVLDCKKYFVNYTLKKNKELLEKLC